MKLNNGLKFAGLGMVLAVIVGCASVGSVGNKMVDNKQEGIIYGVTGKPSAELVKAVCDAIKNKDYRCLKQNNYVLATVQSKVGFADGSVGINVLVDKNSPLLDKMNFDGRTGDKDAPYAKAKVIAGQLGELLEIVSTNGDGKCYWSGMPRTGGTVCPAYNYDYRKDFTGVVFR